MKKQLLSLVVVLLCVGCGNTRQPAALVQSVQTTRQPGNWNDSVDLYRQQARGGSGEAYQKLARCYFEGRGVRRDYLTMLAMAERARQLTGTTVAKFMTTLPP